MENERDQPRQNKRSEGSAAARRHPTDRGTALKRRAELLTVTAEIVRRTVKLSSLYNPDPPITPNRTPARIVSSCPHLHALSAMANSLGVQPARDRRTNERRVLHQLGVRHPDVLCWVDEAESRAEGGAGGPEEHGLGGSPDFSVGSAGVGSDPRTREVRRRAGVGSPAGTPARRGWR